MIILKHTKRPVSGRKFITTISIALLAAAAAYLPAGADEHHGMKRYRLRIPVNRESMALHSQFTLLPGGRGFHISAHEKSSDYLQVNDRVYGPYESIDTPVLSRNGDVAFSYKTWRFPDRFCYRSTFCCKALPLPCLYAWAYSGLYPRSLEEMSRNKGMGYSVQINDRSYGTYTGGIDIRLSRDGSHYMFKYREKHQEYYNIDGKIYGPFRHSYVTGFTMSPDGKRWAYSYEKDRDEYIVVDGKTLGPYRDIREIVTSTDGRRLRFTYRTGPSTRIWVDGKIIITDDRGNRFRSLLDGTLFTRPYDRHITCGAIQNLYPDTFVRYRGKKHGPFEKVGEVTCNSDGSMFGFNCIKRDNHYVYINGRALGPYELAHTPVFSLKGRSYYFYFNRNDKKYVHINGREHGPYYNMRVYFSRNGKAHAMVYSKSGKRYINIGGKTWGPYRSMEIRPVFSPDGSRYGFIYDQHSGPRFMDPLQAYIQLPEKNMGPFDAADLRFADNDKVIIGYVKSGYAYAGEIQQ